MVKKLTAFLRLIVLSLTVALADTQVQDDAGLFTAEEIAEITALCDRIEDTYWVDIFVLTSRDVPDGQTQEYADDYYDAGDFGYDHAHSGMLYLIDMNNRQCYISTCGVMIDYMTDERLNGVLDAGWDEMLNGECGQSVLKSLAQVEAYLQEDTPMESDAISTEDGGSSSAVLTTMLTLLPLLFLMGIPAQGGT